MALKAAIMRPENIQDNHHILPAFVNPFLWNPPSDHVRFRTIPPNVAKFNRRIRVLVRAGKRDERSPRRKRDRLPASPTISEGVNGLIAISESCVYVRSLPKQVDDNARFQPIAGKD